MEESGAGVCSGQLAFPDGSALAAGDMDGEVVVLEGVRKWWSHGALWIFGFLVGVYFASDCGGEVSWNPVAYWRSIQFASRSPWAWTTPEVYASVVAAKKEICGAALVAIGTSAAYAVGGLPAARVALAFTTARTGSRAGRKLVEAADRLRDRGPGALCAERRACPRATAEAQASKGFGGSGAGGGSGRRGEPHIQQQHARSEPLGRARDPVAEVGFRVQKRD